MKFLHPIQSIRDQKVSNFIASVIENVCSPVRVLALAWIKMLIQSRAIKPAEGKRIFREVRGHPIHDHSDATLMKIIDEITKIVRSSVTSRRCVVIANLVTP